MKIITKDNPISIEELKEIASILNNLVKAVVDVEKEIMAVDAELHSDEEEALIKKGSKQENLWGINLYPKEAKENFIEFDSMINLKPSWGNLSRGIDSPSIREKIKEIVNKLVKNG
ncbi:MAG: hypothetical protein J7J25_02590 [Candidatus Omnitrophica bacterium]|nr:hypothetical protein [Candidatus Omnitrophota bacterium]